VATVPAKSDPAQWTSEKDLRAKGFATPRDAYESFLYASTGGDVAGTATAIFLTDEVRKRAEQLLATLPPEKRAEYGTPERLIAALFIAAPVVSGSGSGEMAYQILKDEPGMEIEPRAFGLEESLRGDPNYRTLRSKIRSADGRESEPLAVLVKTDEGWKWVAPSSTVDALERMVKGANSKRR
jgi:hypothetical protein